MSAPSDVRPRMIDTTNDYVGVYVSDTLDLTRKLSLTLGGRYNYARLDLQNLDPDPAFPDLLTGTHTYERFNPMGGLTYKIAPGLSIYGSYAEANRAPTAAELACADPVNPCLIESFLTADPPLKQVVSHTYETGLRGKLATFNNENILEWTAGVFRTENDDDIITVASTINGRGYFTNAGTTLRQGLELGAQYHDRRLMLYSNYAYIDATFQTANVLSSPDNPSGFECIPGNPDAGNCINVTPGSRLPGVPRHRFKIGFDYWLTPEWKFGSDLITVSDQVFFGDEANLNEPLAGYTVVNIHSSYDITKNIQIYGLVNNVFDTHYGLFGNYFNLDGGQQRGGRRSLDRRGLLHQSAHDHAGRAAGGLRWREAQVLSFPTRPTTDLHEAGSAHPGAGLLVARFGRAGRDATWRTRASDSSGKIPDTIDNREECPRVANRLRACYLLRE